MIDTTHGISSKQHSQISMCPKQIPNNVTEIVKMPIILFHACLLNCVLIWGVTSRSNLNNLYLMQKTGLRFIHNLSYHENVSSQFSSEHILCIREIYKQRLSELIFLEHINDSQRFFATYTNNTWNYNFRHPTFFKPKARTTCGQQHLNGKSLIY